MRSSGRTNTFQVLSVADELASSQHCKLANWKQCAWKLATNTDNGKIKECSFNKLRSDTALKVSYQGNIRIYTSAGCNRWYFKFNGNECSGPMTIDSVLYNYWPGGLSNIHRPHFFEGYCENLTRGTPYRFSGWPVKAGSNGIPGIPGVPGIPGSHGSNEEKGTIRKQGLPGAMGIPGNIGPRGFEGPKGEIGEKGQRGPVGTKGSAGIPGNIGPRGFRGLKGENGMIGTKGEKGETADIDPRHLANWKQYTWRGETDTDNGKIIKD
ncbi:hypothetical protein ACROYT_G033611 [Oculina patagonica]